MSAYYLLYFLAMGTLAPYLNLHYHRIGVSPTQLGLMAGIATVIGLFMQPTWGYLADRSASRTRFLALLLLAVGLWALLLSQIQTVVAIMVAGVVFTVLMSPTMPIADSITLREAAVHNKHYSRIRVWGAVGWIITTGASGWLYDRTGSGFMFVVFFIGVALAALWTWRLNDFGATSGERLSLKAALAALGSNRRLGAVLLLAFVVQAGYSSHMLFLPIYLSQQGAAEGLVGLAFSVGALVEVPIFLTIGRIGQRTGPFPVLIAGVAVACTLYLLMSRSPAPEQIVLINMLSGAFFSIYYPTIVTLVGTLVPESLRSTGQGMLAAFTWGLGNMAGTMLGGRVADLIGIPALYGYLIYTALAGGIGYAILGLALRRRGPRQSEAA